ncbi:MAG: hypothetical protein KatS3mg012_0289 [Gaiellaceae bacterium]|jgi:hypothetical protein|nr:MAG: hypothetical protein KatS3mg012_0289 [Gaiellaceae bacterium]
MRIRSILGRIARSRVTPRPLRERFERWRWSRSAARLLGVPRSPTTFNEKTRYKMAHDLRPLLTTLSDKVAAREYVARIIGPAVLPELYLVTREPAAVRRETLPRDVAVKVAHGSGGVVLVSGSAPVDNRLREPPVGWTRFLVHPESVDWDVLRALLADWLSRPYKPDTHWPNSRIVPQILAEELVYEDGAIARDFKLFTFHGRVRVIVVDTNRFSGHVRTLYTPEWERLAFELKFPAGPDVERPALLREMVDVAERLAGGLDFLRVDLYVPGDRLVVGELTSFHGAGTEEFRPASWDAWLGSFWTIPRRYRRPLTPFASSRER